MRAKSVWKRTSSLTVYPKEAKIGQYNILLYSMRYQMHDYYVNSLSSYFRLSWVRSNSRICLYEIQLKVIYSRAILVIVTSEWRVKRVIWKKWTGTLANSADPGQKPQNVTSDQGLHCLLKLQEVKGKIKHSSGARSGLFSQGTLGDNRPTSAVSTLVTWLDNYFLLSTILQNHKILTKLCTFQKPLKPISCSLLKYTTIWNMWKGVMTL